jgi:hypothetical protein
LDYREKFRLELVALAGIDRHEFVRQPGFFQKQRDLGGVWGPVEIEFEHFKTPLFVVTENIGTRRRCRRQHFLLKFLQRAQATSLCGGRPAGRGRPLRSRGFPRPDRRSAETEKTE